MAGHGGNYSSQRCSVCTSPPGVLEYVNAIFSKPRRERIPLRELQKQTGLSRSALSKHSIRCLTREKLIAYREQKRQDWDSKRKVVAWPRERYFVTGTADDWPPAELQPSELTAEDVLIRVQYGPLRPPEKPKPPVVSPYDVPGPQSGT